MKLGPYARSAPYYDFVYESIVDYEGECDLLEAIFQRYGERKVETVLDLGCGTGNHAMILSSRGYRVVGIDRSEEFVRLAIEKSRTLKNAPSFLVGDMTRLDLRERFDALICMFGGFGYIPRERLLDTMRGFAERLKEGGLLIFEFWNTGGVKPGHTSWFEREAEHLTLIRLSGSEFEPNSGVLEASMKYYVIRAGRLEEAFEELHRLTTYLRKDMRDTLRRAGLKPLAMLDWDRKVLETPHRKTFRILAVAKLPGPRR
ncbi:MAG: class I SAM-dependent DNA methyltransferase [Thermoplasmata archaeon]